MPGFLLAVLAVLILAVALARWFQNRHPQTKKMHTRWLYGGIAIAAGLLVLYLLGGK
jgi:uncharacterized membrane protein YidH (DUF202 family)